MIAPDESRARIAADPESGYNGLDLNVEIENPDEEDIDDAPAMDSQHWVTLENGEHVLINGEGEVVAGAGGNLKGKKLSNVKKKSPDVEAHVKNTEHIAKQGAKKFGGDPKEYIRKSSEFAHQYEKTGKMPEGLEKPSNNLTESTKESTVSSQSTTSEGGEMGALNDMPLEKLNVMAKNYDNVQNEGYSDGYNPYREEIERRSYEKFHDESVAKALSGPPKKERIYDFDVPENAPAYIAGKKLTGGVLVDYNGEPHILFKNKGKVEPGKIPGNLYVKVQGKPALENLVASYKKDDEERDANFTKNILSDSERKNLYLQAISQRDGAGWADNLGQRDAAEKAIEVLLAGGTIEEAKAALSKTREIID